MLREGRLTGDVEVSGFDAFAGLKLPAKGRARGAAPAGDDLAERRRQKREAERHRKQLEKRVRELTTHADDAERDAVHARKEADAAEAVAAERRREADEAAAELAELDRRRG
jgi:chromosome segregation ATPase